MSEKSVSVKTERNSQTRGPDKRKEPFFSVLLVGVFGPALLIILLRTFVAFDSSLTWLIIWLDLFIFGAIGPLVVLAVGIKVTKRTPFVVGHVAFTVEALAIVTSLSVLPGWNDAQPSTAWPDFIERFAINVIDVVTFPAGLVLLYILSSLALSGSWLLYRIDAFRSATGVESEDGGGLAKLVSWPKGAKIRSETIEVDDFAVTATIDHPGVPVAKLQSTLPSLEEHGFVRGRSSVIGEPLGGRSVIRMVHSDPLKTWRTWPGPSHPGESFAMPFRTAYYSTGELQWYGFAKTPDGLRSRIVPDFETPNDAHFGRQGATRAGKSGDIAQEICEAMTRRDAVVFLVNLAKLRQDSGWALDFAELAADKPFRAKLLMKGLRRLGEFRSDVMGDLRYGGRHRTWTPETYDELGFPAILLEVDEGDLVLSGSDVTWLTTKGLSLGIYLSVSISRAATDGMASTLRSGIVQWKAFGAGQDYDAGFVLTDETLNAGADPHKFGTEFPGAHYADRLQGVDHRLYPIDARSFKTERTFSDLRQAVLAARATFEVPHLTDGEIAAFGREPYEACRPQAILLGDRSKDDDNPPTSSATASDTPTLALDDYEGDDMSDLLDYDDPETDEAMAMPTTTADLTSEYGEINPRDEIPAAVDDGIEVKTLKPRATSPEQMVAEFDAALTRMAARGVKQFSNADVRDEMRLDMSQSWLSKRFTGLCDEGQFVTPPGITIERLPGGRGQYLLTRLDGSAT